MENFIKMEKLVKLNLGCGQNKLKGYINCDISNAVNPDKIIDLEKKLPFKSGGVDFILAEHVFEHVKNFIGMMHELRRICKNGSFIKIKVPFYSSCEQFSDPTHVRFFTPFSFDYFNTSSKIGVYSHEVGCDKKMFVVRNVKINFSVGRSKILNLFINPLINFNHRIYCKFLSGIIPSSEIEFELEVIK